MPVRRRRPAVLAVLAISALGLGGLAVAATGAKTTTLKLRANAQNQLKFNTRSLTVAQPGTVTRKVTLVMTNPSALPHNIAIRGRGVKTTLGKIVGTGGTSKITVNLKKGRYTFFCSVDGHERAGMKGALTVK